MGGVNALRGENQRREVNTPQVAEGARVSEDACRRVKLCALPERCSLPP